MVESTIKLSDSLLVDLAIDGGLQKMGLGEVFIIKKNVNPTINSFCRYVQQECRLGSRQRLLSPELKAPIPCLAGIMVLVEIRKISAISE